jgi:hypothetical protein
MRRLNVKQVSMPHRRVQPRPRRLLLLSPEEGRAALCTWHPWHPSGAPLRAERASDTVLPTPHRPSRGDEEPHEDEVESHYQPSRSPRQSPIGVSEAERHDREPQVTAGDQES